jgi:hypothetical protein
MKSTIKLSALALTVAAAGSASAALTLNTTGWQADATQTFSISGMGAASAAGVSISAVGTTQQMPDAMPVDPDTGEATAVPVFRFPVTKASVKLFSGGQLAMPISGDSSGTGLKFCRGANCLFKAGLANLSINYGESKVYSDVITPAGTMARKATFSFTNANDSKTKLVGFTILMTGNLKDLVFTPDVATAVGSALRLSAPLQAALSAENWGSIYVNVSSKSRKPKTNATPLTAAAFGL